jgi:hypothetical protein
VCWPPLWSSGQSSWLHIQRSRFDSRSYQIFWEVVGPERGPRNLVSTIEELLGRKRSGSRQENWEYDRKDPSRWPRGTLYPQKLALASPISGGRSVGIVRSRTQATELVCFFVVTLESLHAVKGIRDAEIEILVLIFLTLDAGEWQLHTPLAILPEKHFIVLNRSSVCRAGLSIVTLWLLLLGI